MSSGFGVLIGGATPPVRLEGASGRGVESGCAGSGKREHRHPFSAHREAGIWETGVARGGLIAARTISTVADYASTGVSRQENVRVLFQPRTGNPDAAGRVRPSKGPLSAMRRAVHGSGAPGPAPDRTGRAAARAIASAFVSIGARAVRRGTLAAPLAKRHSLMGRHAPIALHDNRLTAKAPAPDNLQGAGSFSQREQRRPESTP
jgi:hypothetical protein